MKKTTFLLVFLALMPFIKNAEAQVIEADSLALVAIYNAGDGPSWTDTENWLVGDVGTWTGVVIDAGTKRVTELGLNNINFGINGGTLSPAIGDLTALTRFEIQHAENMTGMIPAELWNCTNIGRLQLKYTGLTGGIPAGIESMVNAYELNFQQSYLGGSIPAELFQLPSLTKAYLHQSNFTGAVPSTLDEAVGLQRLYLQENKLEGPLPFVDITDPAAAKVQFTGNFFTYADVKPYHDVAASYAGFTDDYQYAQEIIAEVVEPGEEVTMTGTVTGGEAYAWFKDDGIIPVGSSETLVIAAAGYDNEGTYTCKAQSTDVANFDIRTVYELKVNYPAAERDSLALVAIYNAGDGSSWTGAENWLVGDLDTWTGVVVDAGTKRVTELGLNNISFGVNGGTLSPSIGDLTALTKFEIQHAENLTGSIPAELWNCTLIGRLQIKFTGLTGGIPAGIESMVNAYELNFQQSYLGGSIPAELFQLPSLTKAYLHQSNFTGAVPSTLDEAVGLQRLYLQENKLEGPLPFLEITDPAAAKVQFTGNLFSYDDVKPYHDVAASYVGFTDDYQYAQEPTEMIVDPGAEATMTGTVAGAEAYAWFKDEEVAPVGNTETLVLASVGFDEEGTYSCKAQSSLVANFDIRTVYELRQNYTGTERDSLALVAIYEAGDGANWDVPDTATWLTDPISNWHGVEVVEGRVVTMGLNAMNFGGNGGTLSPMVGQLTELTRFEIQEAPNLTGSIPAELWNCTNIGRLQLKFTGLTGGIPTGIESMVNAYELNFQQSYLGGEIPAELFQLPSLTKAYLHQSNFTGAVPSTLTEAVGLQRLYLQENKLEGPLPFVNITDPAAAKVQLTQNFFSFEDVKQYHDSAAIFAGFTDDYQLAQEDQTFSLDEGDAVDFELYVEGGEAYAWFYNDDVAPISSDTSYAIASVVPTDTGVYVCKVQSSLVANFDIRAIFTISDIEAIPVDIPTLTSAASSEDGTTVTLTFDLEMADASGEASNFTFKEGDASINVSSAATSGSTIVLTLESAISSNTAALAVSYAPGTVQSVDGGLLAGFTDEAVTNNVPTGIETTELNVNIYPIPFTDQIIIESASEIQVVEISDISGKLLLKQDASGSMAIIPVAELGDGTYFITIKTVDSSLIRMVVK